MKGTLNKIVGILLILAAILGMLLSIAGAIQLWRTAQHTEERLLKTTDLAGEALETTSGLLDVLGDMLQQVEASFSLIEASLGDTGLALENTAGITDSIGVLMGEDMVAVLNETQTALSSTKQTARLIDSTLKIVSAIPLIGAKYAPDVPLETTIEQVSKSLDPVPDALEEIESGLQTASTDLAIVKKDLDAMEEVVGNMKTNIGETVVLVETYQQNLSDLQDDFKLFEEKLPGRLKVFNIAALAFFIWLFISQLGLLTQGLELVSGRA